MTAPLGRDATGTARMGPSLPEERPVAQRGLPSPGVEQHRTEGASEGQGAPGARRQEEAESGAYALGFCTLERQVEVARLPMTGRVPSWLSGTLIRNGPAKFDVGNKRFGHWFDGLAMLHRFSFSNGDVSYANKFLESRAYRKAAATGRIGFSEFATDPCRSIFGRLLSVFVPAVTDNANVSVARIADRFVAMTETPLAIEFDPQTLRTLGVWDYAKRIGGHITTAHPRVDSRSGEVVNYVTRFGARITYSVYGIGADGGRGRLIGSLRSRRPAYMHSFGMTENYVVLAEFPLLVRPIELLLRARPFIENFRWEPERGTRFLVMEKTSGRLVAACEGEPFFAFHHVNAFEAKGELMVDLVAYPDASIIEQLRLRPLKAGEPGRRAGQLQRYRVPAGRGGAVRETLSDEPLELPRIHYRRCGGRAYRYVYAAGSSEGDNFLDRLLKVDLTTGASKAWSDTGCYPGEPVFVPAPDGKREDDGVVLAVVLEARKGKSFLLVLDASSFEPMARAEVPHHIPFGFHGEYFE